MKEQFVVGLDGAELFGIKGVEDALKLSGCSFGGDSAAESVAEGNSDVVVEVLDHGDAEHNYEINDMDADDEEDDEDLAEDEEQDGFDPGSLFGLNSSSGRVDKAPSLSPPLDPPSPSQPMRKKKKKSTSVKSAKKVRAEYKKKLQNQRRSLRAIPERNLTLI